MLASKRESKKPLPKKKQALKVQEWVISRHRANQVVAHGYHIQVMTKDALASFVAVSGMTTFKKDVLINRGKTPTGLDNFSFNLGNAVTFTLVGRIEYTGDWEGIP